MLQEQNPARVRLGQRAQMHQQRRGLRRRAEAHGLNDRVVTAAFGARSGGGTGRKWRPCGLGVKGSGAVIRVQGIEFVVGDVYHRRALVHKRQARAFAQVVVRRVAAGADARFEHMSVCLAHQLRTPFHHARCFFCKSNVRVEGRGSLIVASRSVRVLGDGRARTREVDKMINGIGGEAVDEKPADYQWSFVIRSGRRRKRMTGWRRPAVIERVSGVEEGGVRSDD